MSTEPYFESIVCASLAAFNFNSVAVFLFFDILIFSKAILSVNSPSDFLRSMLPNLPSAPNNSWLPPIFERIF